MSDQAALKRQLKIKTGVVKRLLKELTVYKQELEDQQLKLDKFIADGAEDWDIKNGRNMLEESRKMIPHTQSRLEKAVIDLREVVVQAKLDTSMHELEEYIKADETLEEANI
ncbi:tubulin binding cofactor A [Exidia glandulosa HHB12029]|uniref:Tubulin-specific chaperone A n=1 Tax=Exidia glandulosa HHB12029 TaxID=1314781 RepID=A0A165DDR5_EXIGL|nr:tubulin binding cofactor A [Exidia glandulosa HHB12029]